MFSENGAYLATQEKNNNIRIAWIIAGDEIAGVAQAVRGLTTAVRDMGITPVIVSLRSGRFSEYLRELGFDVWVLDVASLPVLRGGLLSKLRLQLKVRQATTVARPKLVECLRTLDVRALQVLWPNLMPLAATAAREIAVACFWEMSNAMGSYPLGANRWLIQRAIKQWNVTVFANSRYTAATLGGFPVEPILLYLGADEIRFQPGRKDSLSRSELKIPENATVLGIVARLESLKGQAVVLEAMAQLPEAYHNAHLLLLGGPVEGEFGDELRALAQRLGVADRLHLIGNVPDPERYYGAIDVAINAYLGAESFGLSVVEAMMMGKPVLVHALGGQAETVIDGVTGWHVHEPTVAGFRAGLIRALGDRKKWPAMGAAGRQRSLEHFSLSRQAKQYVEIVRKRLGS
jgi:glycosyltransferase involved in cell wall biosynthesis